MAEFLDQIRRRRAELLRELAELDAAEKVLLRMAESKSETQTSLPLTSLDSGDRKTIKDMVITILQNEPNPLSALDILEKIQRQWIPNLERTSLSPQLSRLKSEGKIVNIGGLWRIRNENASPTDQVGEAP